MHCHTAQNGAVTAGIVIAVIFLAAAFVKNVSLARVLAAAGIAGALAAMLIPGLPAYWPEGRTETSAGPGKEDRAGTDRVRIGALDKP